MTSAAVVRLRWRPFRLAMRHRFEASHGVLEDRSGILVALDDAQGRTGIGEASPMASLGQGDLGDVIAILERAGAAVLGEGVGSGPGANALRCAIDVARLDLQGQAEGRSIASILAAGDPAPWVQANAVIGGGSPFEVARYGREAVDAGYGVLKVKVGVADVSEDHRRIAALREECPDAVIRLDANGAWDEATAREAITSLAPLGIELLEQPVRAAEVEALARLREHAPMRIAADEAVAMPEALDRVIELRAADLLVLKPMLLGGLTSARAIAVRAAERGLGSFVTTTFDSSIGTAAALQLAASLPVDAAHGLGTGEHLATDVVVATLTPKHGRVELQSQPGLGVSLDEAALEAVATAPWRQIEL